MDPKLTPPLGPRAVLRHAVGCATVSFCDAKGQMLSAIGLSCFRKNRRRMQYFRFRQEGLPIGSGVVEAACKTLVTQRLKRSGMRWTDEGAQAILTPRGWAQSERFDHAWALLSAAYQADVQLVTEVVSTPRKPAELDHVIPFPQGRRRTSE